MARPKSPPRGLLDVRLWLAMEMIRTALNIPFSGVKEGINIIRLDSARARPVAIVSSPRALLRRPKGREAASKKTTYMPEKKKKHTHTSNNNNTCY